MQLDHAEAIAAQPIAAKRRGIFHSSRRFSVVGGILVIVTVIAATAAIWDLRNEAIRNYQNDMSNLGVVLAEQTARSFQAVDLVVQEIHQHLLAAGARSPEQFKTISATHETHELLRAKLQNLPQADAITLVDADGKVANFSRHWPIPDFDVSDRDNYRVLREHDEPGVFIGEPAYSRYSGELSIFLARRVSGPDGSFLGLVTAVIKVGYLRDFYRAITLQQGGSVTLLRRDGRMLARYPEITPAMGVQMPPQSPWYDRVAAGGGTYRSPGFFGSKERVVAVHPVRDYPLVIDVTILEYEALALWRRQAAMIGLGTLCTVIGFALLFRALGAQFRRLELSESSLAARNRELETTRARLERQAVELTRTAEALRASEVRFRDFAETSSDWFWEQDSELRFTWMSDPISDPQYRGKTRWEMAERGVSDEGWAAHRAELTARRPFRDFRYDHVGPDGRISHWSVSGQPILDAAGTFHGYRGTGRDVTAQIAAETQRRELERQLHHSQRIEALGTLAGGIAHDLNNTLVPVLALSKMMLKQRGASDADSSKLETIYKAGQRARDLVKQILAFSRKEAGRKGGVDVDVLVRETLPMIRAMLPATIEIDYSADILLPAVLADPSQLHQVLINLVTNSAQAIGERTGGIAIRLTSDPVDLRLVVSDTGEGMDEATMQRIFEPFFTTKSVGEGTGLGLAVVHGIVGSHDGRIEVRSEPGRGTTFTIFLPRADGTARRRAVGA